MSTQKTAGKIFTELKAKQQDKADVQELTPAVGSDLMSKLSALVQKNIPKSHTDFYIEVCIRMNQFMDNTPEYYLVSRHTCPTPFPDRAVFRYNRKKEDLEFLWHIPSLQEIDYYLTNMLTLRPDEKEALQNILDYKDGTLLRMAKKLNGEVNDYELTFFRKDLNDGPNTRTGTS